MGVLAPGIGRMTPKTDVQQFAYTDLNAATVAINSNSIFFWNLWNGKLGSTNGTNYGTTGAIGIQMARHFWASLFVGIYIESAFDQNITMDVYQMWSVQIVPFTARDIRSKLASVIIPQTNFFRFAMSDALPADGGVLSTPTLANNAHLRVSPGLACPFIGIQFTATTPTAGNFFAIEICRAS